jgi:hypothetical protein
MQRSQCQANICIWGFNNKKIDRVTSDVDLLVDIDHDDPIEIGKQHISL